MTAYNRAIGIAFVTIGLSLPYRAAYAREPVYASLCAKHLNALADDSLDIDSIVPIAFRSAPKEASRESQIHHKGTPLLFLELPLEHAHFKHMYGSDSVVTVRDEEEMRALKQTIQSTVGLSKHDGLSAEAFKERISGHGKDAVVVIVGHNDHGKFHFIDGSADGLAELANTCAAVGALCVFISCNADTHLMNSGAVGLDREIGFADSVKLAQVVTSYIAKHRDVGVSAVDIQELVYGIKKNDQPAYDVKVLSFKGCGDATGPVVALYVHAPHAHVVTTSSTLPDPP